MSEAEKVRVIWQGSDSIDATGHFKRIYPLPKDLLKMLIKVPQNAQEAQSNKNIWNLIKALEAEPLKTKPLNTTTTTTYYEK